MPPKAILDGLRKGQVIPAHPLALTAARKLDERGQRALTRYYCAAGAGGLAVGVHTTQFAVRDPKHALFRPVIELANETIEECSRAAGRPIVKVGGVCGKTPQAVGEAAFLADTGFHIGLVSLGALKDAPVDELAAHCAAVAAIMPIMGFYLQPAVGGRVLPVEFWRRFAEIENAVAIKIAPFNRYQTLDVIRGVAESGRGRDMALYTGNDDTIVMDLLTRYRVQRQTFRIVGGLLGHWAFWTRQAVNLLERCHQIAALDEPVPQEMLTLAVEVTDTNAAAFDAVNNYAGCIAGIHEILVRQGLMAGRWTLDPREDLSPGQKEEIDRVYRAYPHLNDDAFVSAHIDAWRR
jgi:dihydrodipicolinate synthase/N-acetylneuraminate lyase